MPQDQLKVSACIITYNREEFLYEALKSLAQQSLQSQDYEVILVDNNSTDSTPQIAEKFKQDFLNINFISVIEEKQGESAARNRAVKEAHASLVAFIDDDAIATHDYLYQVVDFFDNHPNVMAGGGKILPYFHPSGEKPAWLSHYLLGLVSCVDLGDEIKPFPKYPIGCNMIFRKEVFDQLGNFDSRLGRKKRNLIGSSEKEMFIRMKQQKMPIYYLPDALVYHTMPEERISMDFIGRMSIGMGQSERIRLQNSNLGTKFKILIDQTIRTVGTYIISLTYFFQGEKAKGQMLIWYRNWFIKGFFDPHNEAYA